MVSILCQQPYHTLTVPQAVRCHASHAVCSDRRMTFDAALFTTPSQEDCSLETASWPAVVSEVLCSLHRSALQDCSLRCYFLSCETPQRTPMNQKQLDGCSVAQVKHSLLGTSAAPCSLSTLESLQGAAEVRSDVSFVRQHKTALLL